MVKCCELLAQLTTYAKYQENTKDSKDTVVARMLQFVSRDDEGTRKLILILNSFITKD